MYEPGYRPVDLHEGPAQIDDLYWFFLESAQVRKVREGCLSVDLASRGRQFFAVFRTLLQLRRARSRRGAAQSQE